MIYIYHTNMREVDYSRLVYKLLLTSEYLSVRSVKAK